MKLENNLLVFDLDKRMLGFTGLLEWDLTNCHSATMFRTAQAASEKPLVARITQDYVHSSLYTISINNNSAPLVVDLAGSLVWSTCPSTHATVPCNSATCGTANQQQPRRCRYVDGGRFWAGREPGSHCSCIAHPFNPLTGECSTGDLTSFSMSANTTNGTDVLYTETFNIVGSCSPERLLTSTTSLPLPPGVTGVAGFSHQPLSLPSQLAGGGKFSLCLPVFATFGDTPVYLPNYNLNGPFDYTRMTSQTPFLVNPRNGGYYLPVKRISVWWAPGGPDVPVSLPAGALELDARTGRGGVVLSTTTPLGRVAGYKQFELCYGGANYATFPLIKRVGFDAPAITLELAGGATGNWTILNSSYLRGPCVRIVEMGPEGMPVDGEPAMVIGGMQLENILMVFDLDKRVLGFSRLLDWDLTSSDQAHQRGSDDGQEAPSSPRRQIRVAAPARRHGGPATAGSGLEETAAAGSTPQLRERRTMSPLHLFALAISVLAFVHCTSAQAATEKPLVARITHDYVHSSLYTISINNNGAPLVVDLAGSLVWSTCPSTHATVPCNSATCGTANQQQPRRCRYVDGGSFWTGREPSSHCSCIAHPFNPLTGECSTGDLTSFSMSANTTNGRDVLYPETFTVVGSCAPERLLPANAAGVAGFSHRAMSLPSQLAARRGFGNKFSLCMPGFATFGDTPVYMATPNPNGPFDFTKLIPYTPFLTNPRSGGGGGYYLPVKRISVSWRGPDAVPVSLPAGALELDARTGRGGVVLSTVTPYAIMRPDVFRAFAQAFDTVVARDRYSSVARVAGEEPFELCYGGKGGFALTRIGYDAPRIHLELAGATGNWTIMTGNYLVRGTCVGILQMGPEGMPVDGEPAVVIGLKQLEDNLLVFDLDKHYLKF
uniref:Peptidase A1 domain-containing protein n=1 Tax=Leersia perrieri TaxID=77586 RepID=A0A0D9VA17_9ORYZ